MSGTVLTLAPAAADADQLRVVDLATNTIATLARGYPARPYGVAVDPVTQDVLFTSRGTPSLFRLPAGARVATVEALVLKSPDVGSGSVQPCFLDVSGDSRQDFIGRVAVVECGFRQVGCQGAGQATHGCCTGAEILCVPGPAAAVWLLSDAGPRPTDNHRRAADRLGPLIPACPSA